jgi:hypothetical protein
VPASGLPTEPPATALTVSTSPSGSVSLVSTLPETWFRAATFGASSVMSAVSGKAVGGSLTSFRFTVTVVEPVSAGVPLSVTSTLRLKTGVVSKSSAALLATVISPVAAPIAKPPPVLPPVIAKLCVCPASGSFAATVPTLVPLALFSSIENGPPVGAGASLTSFKFTVTVVEPVSGGVPSSVASTVRLKTGVVSKSSAALLATVISPVAAPIAKAPPVLPPVIAKLCVCPASGSVTVTVPTLVPLALFSSIENGPPAGTGVSLTSFKFTVTVVEPVRAGVPLSVTSTVRLNTGVVSKSSAALLATVISPVAAPIAKAPPVLPAVIAKLCVCPASGSFAATVPTLVPLALFSSIANGPPVGAGCSLTSFRFTVTVVEPVSAGVPLSVTSTVRLKTGVVSKSSAALLATVISPVAAPIAKPPPVLPPVIAKLCVCPASGSFAATVPTLVPLALFSSIEKGPPVGAGVSLTSSRFTVTVVEPVSAGVPSSVTSTVRLNTGVVSKSSAALLATVISPVAAPIAKAPPVLPPVIAKLCVCPASGSFAATVPTLVPLALFSSTENGPPVGAGVSLTSSRFTVTVVEPVSAGVPSSVTSTVRLNTGVVSKSSAALLATVISPVAAPIAKAPPVLPPVIAKLCVCPASGSFAATVPTLVPLALFSSTENGPPVGAGSSLTSFKLTVTVADPVAGGVPSSVTSIVRLKVGVVSKSSAALSATVISPVAAPIAKAPPVLPAVIAKVCVWPASGSFAATVPTLVPLAPFSSIEKGPPVGAGSSLTSFKLTVTVADPVAGGVPSSVTSTVREKLGVVSKSSAVPSATVISPVVASIAKAPPVLPPVIAKVWLWPASGSTTLTVPTTVPSALFSSIEKGPPDGTGVSLTSVTVTSIAWSSVRPPASVTVTSTS